MFLEIPRTNVTEGSPNGIGDLERLFCQSGINKGKPHEDGDWELVEKKVAYKVMARFCRYCKKKTHEKVLF